MSPRRLRIALWISLGVNLLVAGAVIGAVLFGPGGPDRRGGWRSGPPEMIAFARAFDEPRRVELRTRLRGDAGLRQGRARIGESRRAVLEALTSEPFEAAALRAALEGQRRVQTELAQRGLETLVEMVAGLSPEERAAFAAALEEQLAFRGREDRR
ncbi:MAG: periplasmic heavy metal sensor [Jannaschia sp.]